MPRQQIHRASLTVARIGHFGRRVPVGRLEASLQPILETSVGRIEQAGELAAAPSAFKIEAKSGLSADGPDDLPAKRAPSARLHA